MAVDQVAPNPVPVIIGAGASLSTIANMGAQTLHGIAMPAAWTAADLTFQVSYDGGATFREMVNSAGVAIDYQAVAGNYVAIDPLLWRSVNCIRIRSGTFGAPVNQVAAATITLILMTIV